MAHDPAYFEEKTLEKSYDLRLLGRLAPFIIPYAGRIAAAVVLVVLITLTDLATPYITKEAMDRYIVPGMTESGLQDASFPVKGDLSRAAISGLGWITLVFLAVIAVSFVLEYFQMMLLEYSAQRIMHDLRMAVFDHIQTLDLDFFSRNPLGRLVTRVTNDVQNMNELFTSVLIFVFKDLFIILGIGLVMLMMNWRLALVCMTIVPFVILAVSYFSLKAREAFRTLRIKAAEINSRFSETVEGIDVIQLFGQEAENRKRFEKINEENFTAGMRQVHVFAVFMPVIEILSSAALAMVIFYGGHSVFSGRLTIGELTAFIAYIKMFFRPVRDIAEKYNIMQDALSSAERLFQILDHPPAADHEHPAAAALPRKEEKIRKIAFDGVCFSYNKKEPVLENITFEIDAGQSLAVVGPTGSGKTTLIQLLMRFYEPDRGQILVNDRPIRDWDTSVLRSKMALVTQEPFLFSGTISDNIRHEGGNTAPEVIRSAVEGACLSDWLATLPQGLETPLTQGGRNLSSGQRQLISIARALARRPDLILLDEATSYVDTASEQVVQKAISNLMAKRTAILIAHRLETARKADRILVMREGRIIESGHHEALIARQGFYQNLYRLENI